MTPTKKISQEKFLAYEKVRLSGKTNMFDIQQVIALSRHIVSREDCLEIMRHYGFYKDTYWKE